MIGTAVLGMSCLAGAKMSKRIGSNGNHFGETSLERKMFLEIHFCSKLQDYLFGKILALPPEVVGLVSGFSTVVAAVAAVVVFAIAVSEGPEAFEEIVF